MDPSAITTGGTLALLALVAAALVGYAWRSARALGILAPLGIALLLRMLVAAVAHLLSSDGFLYLDDQGYAAVGWRLAEAWRNGALADPTSYEYGGSVSAGYFAFVGVLFTGFGQHALLAKLTNACLGALLVVPTARVADLLVGRRAAVWTAWGVALCPTLIWWSAPLLKEQLTALILLAGLAAALWIPRAGALVGAFLAVAALATLRLSAALGLAAAIAVVGFARARDPVRRLSGQSLIVGVVGAVGLLVIVTKGDPQTFVSAYRDTAQSMLDTYQGGSLLSAPVDVGRAFVAPYPWVFDADTANPNRALYPGMWAWYLVLPVSGLGIVRLRRQPAALALLVLPILSVMVLSAAASGAVFRQRSSVEPLLLILAAVGAADLRSAGFAAAVGLMGVAIGGAVQSHSPVLGGALLIAAGAIALASRRLPHSGGPLERTGLPSAAPPDSSRGPSWLRSRVIDPLARRAAG
jgi:hypothetical protein